MRLAGFLSFISNVPVNSKTAHSSPGKPPGIWLFFKKKMVKFPAILEFRRSNASLVRASKRVKSPTLQGKQNRFAYLGNKFCKIFSHYKFLVQLVFAARFKQRHILRYNHTRSNHRLWVRSCKGVFFSIHTRGDYMPISTEVMVT